MTSDSDADLRQADFWTGIPMPIPIPIPVMLDDFSNAIPIPNYGKIFRDSDADSGKFLSFESVRHAIPAYFVFISTFFVK